MTELGKSFLLLGPELGEKEVFVNKLKEKIRKSHPDLEESRYYPFETSMTDVVSRLRNGSLFSDAKWVEILQAETLKKEDAAVLAAYLKDPAADSVLLLLSDGLAKDVSKAVTSAIPQDRTKIFWELFENQKHDWIRGFFREKNIGLDEGVIDILLELVENNTRELKKECQRLALVFAPGSRITADDVESYIFHSREENVFTLFDRFAGRDLAAVLEVLRMLKLSGESQPVQILSGLVWQFRRLLELLTALEQRGSFEDACRAAGINGKRMQKSYRRAKENFTRQEMERVLLRAAETDGLLRRSRPEIHECLMDLFFYRAIS